MSDIMTLKEAAAYLRLHPSGLYKLAQEGKVPASKVGNRWRFQRQVIDQWLREQAGEAAFRHPVALVVDDDRALCDTIAEALTDDGYRVFAAYTGEEAVELIEAMHFDVAFVDLKLPVTSGVEVLRALSEGRPRAQSVIITGYPDSELMNEALELGSFAVLKKPFRLDKLLEIARTLRPSVVSRQGLRYKSGTVRAPR